MVRTIFPDCMMPDGAEPCEGFTQAVAAERERCATRFEKFVRGLADYVEREEGMRHLAAIRKGE
jgi:hypothetical protein